MQPQSRYNTREVPMVRKPQPDPAPPATVGKSHGGYSAAVALLIFGGMGWLAGGKYTVEGWTVWANWFLHWVGFPIIVPALVGWWVLLIIPAAFVYSQVEVRYRPRRGRSVPLVLWAAWIIVVITDVGSTFAGVKQTTAPATSYFAPLIVQVVSSDWLSLLAALLLTFTPEWLIIGSFKLFGRSPT